MLLTLTASMMVTPFLNLFLGSATGTTLSIEGLEHGRNTGCRVLLNLGHRCPATQKLAAFTMPASLREGGLRKLQQQFFQSLGILLSKILVSAENKMALLSFQTPLTLLSYLSVP